MAGSSHRSYRGILDTSSTVAGYTSSLEGLSVDAGAALLGGQPQASARCRGEQVDPPTSFRLRPREPQHPGAHSHIHVPIPTARDRAWISVNQSVRAPP